GVAPGAITGSRGAISFGDIAVESWAKAGDARIALAATPVSSTNFLVILGSLTVMVRARWRERDDLAQEAGDASGGPVCWLVRRQWNGASPDCSAEAAALRHVDLHQPSVMDGELDHAITQAFERLRYMAQVFGEVGMGLFDLVDKGRHRSVSGVVGGCRELGPVILK